MSEELFEHQADQQEPELQQRQYLLYDRSTGEVLVSHGVVTSQDEHAPTLDDVRALLQHFVPPEILERGDLVEAEAESQRRHFIDAKERQLKPQLAVRIEFEKRELEGDGEDSTGIEITVVDPESEEISRSFSGPLVVTTSRGRLSARGGRIEATEGQASLRLTSVPETVHEVQLVVHDPKCRVMTQSATVEFV